MSIKKCSFNLQNYDLLVCFDHKPLLKIFKGHTEDDKCNIWGLEAAAIPRRVKVQYIKGIANVPCWLSIKAQSSIPLSWHWLKRPPAGVQYHLHPYSPIEPVTHMPVEVKEVFITPDIERLIQTWDTSHGSPIAQTNDDIKLSLENVSTSDILKLEQNLMFLPELTLEKVIKLQKNDIFSKNGIQHIGCSKYDNYFIDTIDILQKNVIDFNSIFSAVVIPQILIKYLLHALH